MEDCYTLPQRKRGMHMKPKVLHVCRVCHKIFPQRYRLLIHAATHSEERNFPCVVCQKRFKSKNSLSYHAYSHFKNGDIDSMEWFPELMTPSKRKPRSENKRKTSAFKSITSTDFGQPAGAVPDAVTATSTNQCSSSGGNWTVSSIGTGFQSDGKNEEDNSVVTQLNRQEGKCGMPISPIYPIQTANGLRNCEQDKKNNPKPNVTCPAADAKKICRLRIVSTTTGQEYHVNINNPVRNVQREGQQRGEPDKKNNLHLCRSLVHREGQNKSAPKFYSPLSCGGFLTSTPKGAQGSNGTSQPYFVWNPQLSTSGCSPNSLLKAHTFEENYEGFKNYGTENLKAWETISEDEFQTSLPLKSSTYLNNCAMMANNKQMYPRFDGSKEGGQTDPQWCDEAGLTDTENVTLTWNNENVVSQLWNRNASALTGSRTIPKKADARNDQLCGGLNIIKSFDKTVRTLGNFGIEQTEIGYGIDGKAVYIKHRGYCLSPQATTSAIQNAQRT
ncbi:Zinc finger, C2H2 type family protein [Trichuris trichiura]|uniref:Zinc finger, C2H2 type family protein n=1 Tax=Trichuris trichiura TaxID=36087 RepID=A0A077ZM18_TRITR|nr:Zinc finger, C2H2 type family protein [Trichuris trichiura]